MGLMAHSLKQQLIMARKKQNKCLVTEKDIVFSVIYERHQGYSAPGGKQTKAGMKKRARNAFEGMKFIKGFSPRLAEWVPITKCEDSPCFARIKYCFRCSISALKKFFFNTSMDFDANTMGILWDKDEHIDAYSFSSPLISDYVTAYDRDWFKRFGIRTDGMYEGQNLSSENAYVGVSIPEARLVEAIEHTFGKKLEDIKEKRILNNIQINMDKLVQSYTLVLNWVRDLSEDSYSFEEPIPHFEIDFREQDLFA